MYTVEEIRNAYDAGFNTGYNPDISYRDGVARNPHPVGTELYEHWRDGFSAGQDELDNDTSDDDGDNFRDDVEADADALRSAGFGTDEDYGLFDGGGDWD